MLCASKATLVTNVTAPTEPYAAATAPALAIPSFFRRKKKVIIGIIIADKIFVNTAVITNADSSL